MTRTPVGVLMPVITCRAPAFPFPRRVPRCSMAGPVPAAGATDLARLQELLGGLAPTTPPEVRPEHRLLEDLGFDSMALVKTVVAVEDAFSVELPRERLHELRTATVADVAELVRSSAAAAR